MEPVPRGTPLLKPLPCILKWVLFKQTKAITLPPFGMYARIEYLHDLSTEIHEAVHWEQYLKLGVLRFYTKYLWLIWQYGYAQHPMELEACAVTQQRLAARIDPTTIRKT